MKKHGDILIGLYLLFISSNAGGTIYYCSPSGSMADSGTSITSPWGSLHEVFAAGTIFNSGDTIMLMSGNHGYPVITGVNSGDVVITPFPGNNPILNCIDFKGASHWILENIRVYNPSAPPREPVLEHPVYPLSDNTLLRIMNGSSYITIAGCYIYSIENSGSWTATDWNYKAWNGVLVDGTCSYTTVKASHINNTNFALELSGSKHTSVIHNLVENFCGDAIIPGNFNSIEYNTFRDSYKTNGNHCDLVQAFNTSDLFFNANILIGRTSSHSPIETDCQGIGFFDGTFRNCIIENNVISVETYHGLTIYNAINCKIVNNTLIDMTSGGLVPWMHITGSGNRISNNISSYMNTLEGSADHNIVILRSKYSDYFIDAENLDFHLKAGSPAIDAGSDLDVPQFDLENNPRPQYEFPDVGAYEYSQGPDTIPPAAPINVKVQNASASGFTLSWSPSTDNIRVSEYIVFMNGEPDTIVKSHTVTWNSLQHATTYTLLVIAKDAAGNNSAESDSIQATTLDLMNGIEKEGSESYGNAVSIYPNPLKDGDLKIQIKADVNRIVGICISDITGRIVFAQPASAFKGNITLNFPFGKGIYFVNINDRDKTYMSKLLVE